MALVVKDRVKQTSTTTGTGTLTLNGTVDGFQTFAAALSDGDTTYYALLEPSTNEWEVGLGTWTEGSSLLARTTILASSNSGSAVSLTAQSEVFITQPATKAAFFNADGDLELNRDPQTALQAATKEYVDTIAAAGLHYHDPVRVEKEGNLNVTYNNGTAGVGATLTNAGTQAALVIDGVTMVVNDRVLVYEQSDATQNGVYTVTNVGSGSTNWVLTRSTDTDSYAPSDPNSFGKGDAFFVLEGNAGAGELYVMNTEGTITFGTTNITFTQVASTAVYSAGNGVTLTGTVFSADAGTGVTVDGSGINIGQAVETTSDVTFNTVAADLTGSVTGNVTGDVTGNADTATALETARNIGGVSFDGTASINLPGVNTTGNQDTTGNAATATAWETGRTISLTGDVTGSVTGVDGTGNASIATTIQPNSVALGTDTTGNYVATVTSGNYLTGGTSGEGSTPTLNVDATPTNTASKVVARDASGNFSAGTVTAALSGNASTASTLATARNIAVTGAVTGNANFDGSGNISIATTATSDPTLTLNGDVSGSATFTNLGNATLTVTVADDSHNHTTANIDNFTESVQDIAGGMWSGNSESGVSVTYQDTDGTLDINVNDPTITLTGAVTGSGTMTNLGNVSIATTATADPTLTLSGDASGSATFTNLGNATLSVTVADDSHNHVISNVDGLQTALDGKLSTSGKAADSNLLDGIDSGSFLRSDATDSFTGDIYTTSTNGLRFGSANQTDTNDGIVAAGRFASGLNIIGTQTTAGTGRQVRIWGSVITESGSAYWHAGNDGSGSGLDADLWDGNQFSSYLNQSVKTDASPTFNNAYIAGSVYHSGDTDTRMLFGTNTITLQTGGSSEITVNSTGVRLGDTGNGYFQPVTGNYGSVQIDGGAHTGYEGYSIGGESVFMSDGNRMGLYDDTNNEWAIFYDKNAGLQLHYNGASKLQTTSTGVNIDGNLNAVDHIYLAGNMYHEGDTNTYTGFHAADQWRVVTGGTERLEVTNSGVRIDDAFTLPTTDGSADQVLKTNGSGTVTWGDAGGGVAAEQQTFNSSGTWTKPAGVTWVQIECWAGGGSGCRGNFAGQTSGGGGGGAYTRTVVLASSLGSTETVTVGAGGAATDNNSGLAGGDTSFGSIASAKGGKGGINSFVAPSVPYSRFNTTDSSQPSILAFSYAGMPGSGQPYWGGNTIYGGGGGGGSKSGTGRDGGTSVFGGAGGAGGASAPGVAGTAPGGGGGGSDSGTSGAGAAGRVVVSAW